MDDHNKAVQEFLRGCAWRDPENYAKVCRSYPVLSGRQWKNIRQHEVPYTVSEIEDLYSSDAKLEQED